MHPLHHPGDHQTTVDLCAGEGIYLYDVNGRRYIDGLSGLWNVAVAMGEASWPKRRQGR